MMKINYPTSDEARGLLLDTVLERRTEIPESQPNPLGDSTVTHIGNTRDDLQDGVRTRDTAKTAQTAATEALKVIRRPLALGIRHFHSNHRMLIKRGLADPSERGRFGLDAGNLHVPLLNTDAQIAIAVDAVLTGEEARREAGNVPITMPSQEDMQAFKTTFTGKKKLQAEKKLAYDRAQNTLELIRKQADRLIRNLYRTLSVFFKNQGLSNADVRRILREWGFKFRSDSGEPVDEEENTEGAPEGNIESVGDEPEGTEEAA